MQWASSNALWDLLPGWAVRMAMGGGSEAHRGRQRRYVEAFVFFAQERGVVRADAVTPQLVRLWAAHLARPVAAEARPLSAEAQYRRLVALRAFLGWCVELGAIAEDPMAGLPLPRRGRSRERRPLSHGQVEAALALPEVDTPVGLRDRALLEVAYSTGLRAGELTALTTEAVQADSGLVRVVQGKGGRDRVVPVGVRALRWVARYQADGLPALLRTAQRPGPALWWGVRGAPMTARSVSRLAAAYLRAAGVPVGRGAAHLFRHSMATHLLEGGAGVEAIGAMLGHERARTTPTYTHVSFSALASQLERVRGPAAG